MHHLLGTDQLGRDVLSRLLYGGVVSLTGVGEVLAVALILGVPLGLLAGFRGGVVDGIFSRSADLGLAIPAIVVLLVAYAVFNDNQTGVMITLGVLFAPFLFRVVRGATVAVRKELYVNAARVAGLRTHQIISRHIVPRVTGPLVVNCSILAATTLITQSGLNYLGLGVQPPNPSWGGMIADAQSVMQLQPWLLVPSGGIIGLTVIAFILLGDGVRDSQANKWSRPSVSSNQLNRAKRNASNDWVEPSYDISAFCSLRNLSVAVPRPEGETVVLTGVDLDLAAGETLGIVGESGCGKTLTALSIIGLLPGGARVVTGGCQFLGKDLFQLSAQDRAALRGKQIAYISQDPMASLDPTFTVGFQLAELVRRHSRLSAGAAKQRAIELLEIVRIPSARQVAHRYPHEISGGMAQRVCTAAAIAGNPRLLIADEPTTALDVTVQAEILELLRTLQQETGMAILIVTHDWGVVADICDRAAVFYAGQVVEYGDTSAIVRAPAHPYTRALLAANPQFARVGEPLPSILGNVPSPEEWNRATGCRFADRCGYATPECTQQAVALLDVAPGRTTRCIHHEFITRELSPLVEQR
jgi:peptide/nickel transport system permease protein